MKQLALMLALVADKFKDKLDRGGKPYMMHCIRVMLQLDPNDEDLLCIGVGHDLFEDTDITSQDLVEMGFSGRVIQGILTLTWDDMTPYESYIKELAKSPDCKRVKLADLKDNSDITRLKGVEQKDFERIQKYHRAWVYLNKP